MTQIHQIWKCNICGNIVEVLHEGSDSLVCCGQPMVLMAPNTVDASLEKHLPVIEKDKEGVIVKIGSEPHPMTKEHYIEWIEISTERLSQVQSDSSESQIKGSSKKFLKPGEKPEAKFPVKAMNITARAYCSLHGLWKS